MISFSAVLRHSVVLLSISVLCTNGYAQNALPPTKYVQQTTSWVGTIQPVSSPLALGGTPSNNTCDQAVVEPLAPGSDVVRTGDNTGATDEIGLGVPQVWEAFTTTECMDVTVSYCGTDPVFQGALTQLYMGCPYGNLVRTGSGNVSQEACGDGNFSILFPQLPPDTYFYAVLGGAGSEGAYTLTFSGTACTGAPPTNNDCPGAVVLTPGTDCITVGADVLGANISGPSLPSITCGGFTGNASEDVWFSFVATAEEHVISVDGSDGFDAVIDLRDGSCANSNNIACQDGVSAGGVEVLNATNLTIGETYFIRVYDWYAGLPLTTTFDICVQGGPVEPCAADAGTLTAVADSVCLEDGSSEIGATPNGDAVVPMDNAVLFVLTGQGIILDTASVASFTVTAAGDYTIHTLVYDPATLDLGILELGVTTAAAVNELLIQGGGTICASLDLTGADVNVADCPGPCLADAGTLTADPAEVCLVNGLAPLMAVPNGDGFIPPGYIAVFALSDGTTIISGADDPEFTVVSLGSYTIHTFVVDTLTFELGSVIFGTTTIAEVNSMLIQGGGDICGSLDLNGTTIEVIGCPPANDACSAATPLAVQLPENCPAAATVGDNTFAVEEGDGPSCDPTTAGYTDVWYTFNSGANTEVTISLDPGTMTSWGLVVLDACNGNEVLCEVEGVDPLVVATTVDTEYRVRVYTNTQFGTGGVFAICVSGAEEATICDGGSLSTSEDISSLTICSDGEADVVEFFTTSTSSLDYAYFLTTVEDTIVTGLSGNSIDLDPAPLGNYRVWGVSYDGVLNNANTGNSIADISATGECLEWSDDFISVSIEICTDMADRAERSWGIHPNPVVDVLNLSWTTDGMATVEVLDANGRVLQVSQARMVSGGRTMLSFHGMASGVYVIRITTEGARNVARVIVR